MLVSKRLRVFTFRYCRHKLKLKRVYQICRHLSYPYAEWKPIIIEPGLHEFIVTILAGKELILDYHVLIDKSIRGTYGENYSKFQDKWKLPEHIGGALAMYAAEHLDFHHYYWARAYYGVNFRNHYSWRCNVLYEDALSKYKGYKNIFGMWRERKDGHS